MKTTSKEAIMKRK